MRFLAGTSNNVFTVGRDFLFEICFTKRLRIFGFSLKSIFTLAGTFIGPWIGLTMYNSQNDDFEKSSKIISMIFFFVCFLFFIIFYIIPTESTDSHI